MLSNEKNLEALLSVLNTLREVWPAEVIDTLKADPAKYPGRLGNPAVEAFAVLLVDAYARIDKSAGRANSANAIKRTLAGAKKYGVASCLGIFPGVDGKNYATDGRIAFRFSADFPALPHNEEGLGFPKMGDLFQVKNAVALDPDDLPTLSEVKRHISAHGLKRSEKGERPAGLIEVGDGHYFNAFYLLDALEFFGDDPDLRAVFAPDRFGEASPRSMMKITGAAGECILLPVKKD